MPAGCSTSSPCAPPALCSAASRADSAPRQFCVGKRKRQTPVGDGGAKALTYDIETKAGGGTAGQAKEPVRQYIPIAQIKRISILKSERLIHI